MPNNSQNYTKLSSLVKVIRECKDCETTELNDLTKKGIPFVFVGKHPQILVVSEIPSKSAWKKNEGKDWIEGKSILPKNENRGISNKLCKWLEIDRNLFKEKILWIQRANCCVDKGKEFALQHCSEKFIRRVIESLKPKLIITLGKPAAQYFFQFKELKCVFKQEIKKGFMDYKVWGASYKCLVLPHPSAVAKKYHGIIKATEMKNLLQEALDYFT